MHCYDVTARATVWEHINSDMYYVIDFSCSNVVLKCNTNFSFILKTIRKRLLVEWLQQWTAQRIITNTIHLFKWRWEELTFWSVCAINHILIENIDHSCSFHKMIYCVDMSLNTNQTNPTFLSLSIYGNVPLPSFYNPSLLPAHISAEMLPCVSDFCLYWLTGQHRQSIAISSFSIYPEIRQWFSVGSGTTSSSGAKWYHSSCYDQFWWTGTRNNESRDFCGR